MTVVKKLLFLALLVGAFSACKHESRDCSQYEWAYEGNEGTDNWATMCDGYSNCGGIAQSPVDITAATVDAALPPLNVSYYNSTIHLLNNGHTIVFNYDTDSKLTLNGVDYALAQFHFHTGSEHTLGGTRYPMEMHIVHRDSSGNLAVIGVVFEEGPESAFLNNFIGNIPTQADSAYTDFGTTINAWDALPADKSYYTYSGSLTTPPCSESVSWFVMKNHVTASAAQIAAFEAVEHQNFRPTQSLNGRIIREYQQ